jgi:hypothetical protein
VYSHSLNDQVLFSLGKVLHQIFNGGSPFNASLNFLLPQHILISTVAWVELYRAVYGKQHKLGYGLDLYQVKLLTKTKKSHGYKTEKERQQPLYFESYAGLPLALFMTGHGVSTSQNGDLYRCLKSLPR